MEARLGPSAWRLVAAPLALVLLLAGPAAALPVLRVATSGDYAPFAKEGRGFDVEVATAAARDLGYRLEWVRFTWPGLQAAAERGDFDVAMSGVTWRPRRAVAGYLSRAVAAGGPCVLGVAPAGRVGVNRGGILETFALERFGHDRVMAIEDNASLPTLLESGRVGAIVTDSFELPHFSRRGWVSRCWPPRDRKVYWVTRAAPRGLGERLDAWIAENEPLLQRVRERWLGDPAPRSDAAHVIDLLARRLALMPAVGAYKRAHGLPIEDLAREERVLSEMRRGAAGLGLDLDGPALGELFRVQIDVAKAIQRREGAVAPVLPLERVRATLVVLGDRIVRGLATIHAWSPVATLDTSLLGELLTPDEVERLRGALARVQTEQQQRLQRQ